MKWYTTVLQKYAEFNGRASRSEYWYFVLFNLLIAFVLGFISGYLAVATNTPGFAFISSLYSLGVLIPTIAVGIRRMHDVGKSGWFIIIPIYNLILACTEGTRGPNEYGPDPKLSDDPAYIH